MRLLGILLTTCVVLAAVQAAAVALSVLLLLALIYGAFTRPRETFGLFGFCLIANLIDRQPLVCVLLVTLLLSAKLIFDHR